MAFWLCYCCLMRNLGMVEGGGEGRTGGNSGSEQGKVRLNQRDLTNSMKQEGFFPFLASCRRNRFALDNTDFFVKLVLPPIPCTAW